MKNDNSTKRVLLSRNIQSSRGEQNKGKDKKKEKEKLSHSQRTFNKNNHVHYYSKSTNQTNLNVNKEKEISKKLSFNDIDDNEELDHPKPLISDDEDDIENIKNNFNKIINENSKNSEIDENQDLNLKFIPKRSELKKNFELPSKSLVNNKNKKDDNYIFVPLKTNYKSETMSRKQINHIKAQINNKMNYIISNDDIINYNTDKKKIPIKKPKKEINNNKRKIYEYDSSNNLNKNIFKNIPNESLNNFSQIINENYNYINIPNPSNINLSSSNQVNKINNKLQMINNQKQQIYSAYISENNNNDNIIKEKIEEECERKNSVDKYIQTEPNIKINNNPPSTQIEIPQAFKKDSKIKNIIKRKSINITNINNLFPNEEIQISQSERSKDKDDKILEINKVDISNIPKIQNESKDINININNVQINNENNSLNLQKVKSSEIKSPLNFQKNIFYNKLEAQNNSKYRKKTFERGGKFNNVQTTYIVISKKKSMRNALKSNLSNITPEIIDYNKYKIVNPTPSANYLNNTKIFKEGNIPQRYSSDLKFHGVNINEQKKKFGLNKSYNNLPVKRYYDYNNFVLNNFSNNNYDTNYKNYVGSSIKGYNDDKGRNTCFLINKPNNISNTNIYNYDLNYEYYYYTNPIQNNHNNSSYISFSNQYNYKLI